MNEPLALICPIRGQLKVSATGAGGLKPLEEKYRIDAIRHLLSRGYPQANFLIEPVVKLFGSGGKNSLRADMAVLDVSADSIGRSVDEVLAHTVLLGEVKRDNASYEQAKKTQVRPMLDFASRTDCVGLYWDDIEQRVFWRQLKGNALMTNDGPLTLLPEWGNSVILRPLTYGTITASESLLAVFNRLDDILHQASVAQMQRPEIILQLLLAKLFDEHSHEPKPDEALGIQDFVAQDTTAVVALSRVNGIVSQAVGYYGKYLPNPVASKLSLSGETVREISRVLAPVKIIASKQSVIQDFYMHFAKGLYRWELGQYFTPTTVSQFVVQVLNPRFGEHVKDPACGSADFLTAAFRIGRTFDATFASAIHGSDNSAQAVQVAVLNMLLNGDGKTNIFQEDSLAQIERNVNTSDILVCNPPFGSQILERRTDVLALYDLGHSWVEDIDQRKWTRQDSLLRSQETGILFVENCVRQAKSGGRIGIILPNGYLGNRSSRYRLLRHWVLRHCRVAAVCAFPRFTFKGSGADVSASIVYLEKRHAVINSPDEDLDYVFAAEVIERVGWNVGNKRAEPIYRRDADDGSYLVGEDGELVLDADFPKILDDIDQCAAATVFPWLHRSDGPVQGTGWAVSIRTVLNEPTLCLDAKRYCRKVVTLQSAIAAKAHFKVGEVARIVPEMTTRDGGVCSIDKSKTYRHVQIDDMDTSDFRWSNLKGWDLPDRARHMAEPGDIFVGSIWGSVGKWFITPEDATDLIVTNGCHRLAMRDSKAADDLIDLVAGLCSEAYATQMRAYARGSDGLAEVSEDDLAQVILPKLTSEQRASINPFVRRLLGGRSRLDVEVRSRIDSGNLPYPQPTPRPTHSVLV